MSFHLGPVRQNRRITAENDLLALTRGRTVNAEKVEAGKAVGSDGALITRAAANR